MTNQPLVTVIMPTYNRVEFSTQTVESILNQTYKNLELIAISDGCTDSTIETLKKISDPRLIIVEAEHVGQPANHRNLGIEMARGDYIAFADDDDLWVPSKLMEQIDFLENNQDIDLIGSQAYLLNSNYIQRLPLLNRINRKIYNFLGKYSRSLLLTTNVFFNSTVVARKHVISNFRLNTSPEYKAIEDYDLWLRITKKHKSYIMNELLIFYRVHANSISCPLMNLKKAINVLQKLGESTLLVHIGILQFRLKHYIKKTLKSLRKFHPAH